MSLQTVIPPTAPSAETLARRLLDEGRMAAGRTPEAARGYRQRGHDDALRFALAIGLNRNCRRGQAAKKDVIDLAGDAHPVKSGRTKWPVFLHSRNRFLDDDGFQAPNGIGSLPVHCIDAFPPRYSDHEDNRHQARLRLQALKDRFQRKALLRAFLRKSIFNGGEVQYLTVLRDGVFCVCWSDDVRHTKIEGLRERASRMEDALSRMVGGYPEPEVLNPRHEDATPAMVARASMRARPDEPKRDDETPPQGD